MDKLPLICGGFLNVTQKCNLACPYCFVCQRPKQITYKVAEDTAKFFAKNALIAGKKPSINFFGGEPMLRFKDIIKPLTIWIRETYGDGFELSLTTNGTLLTREVMEFFKEYDVSMLFSIDGGKKTQDVNRPFHGGRGSFDHLEKIIDLVLEFHPNMTFRATIDRPTHKFLYENYLFAVSKGYKNSFFIPNIFPHHDQGEWTEEELAELKAELVKIKDYYISELSKGSSPMIFSHFEEAKADIMRIIRLKDSDFREDGKGLIGSGRCGLGAGSFAAVGVTGNLYSCQEMSENPEYGDTFTIGNIYTGVDEEKRFNLASSFKSENVFCSKKEYCDDCPKKRICSGGCTINNFFRTGSLDIQDYVICWYERTCLEMAYEILNACKKGGFNWGKTAFIKECEV